MKNTQGKWEVRPVNAEVLPHHLPLNGIYKGGILLATTGNYNHTGSEDITNLIAAAPELLEACKEALKEFNGMGYVPEKAISMLEQAIIKAEE